MDRYVLNIALSQYNITEEYLRHRSDRDAIAKAWEHLMTTIPAAVRDAGISALFPVTESFVEQRLQSNQWRPAGLDRMLLSEIEDIINGNKQLEGAPLRTIKNLITCPSPLVEHPWKTSVLSLTEAVARRSVDDFYTRAPASRGPAINRLLRSLQILGLFPASELYVSSNDVPLFITFYEVAFLLPQITGGLQESAKLALELWHRSIGDVASLGIENISVAVATRLGAYILETDIR